MSTDLLIFLLVVGMRFGIPLLIPRFPLPAIFASLVIDAADQTIFQEYTDLDLEGYQGYDKALDVYYLTIAYLSTIRNWTDPFAFRTAQFLWYYRLVGVTMFELTQARALLIIFANTFEYFFIAYELVRCWWDPRRLGSRTIVTMAAGIWIFIKLPQEWWIHIAQLDFTDFVKGDLLGVPTDSSWGTALGENLWFVALLAVVAVVLGLVIHRIWQRAPERDWSFTIDVDRHLDPDAGTPPETPWWQLLGEKIALSSLVAIIFGQVVPDSDATPLQLTFAIALLITASAAVSHWLSTRRDVTWATTVSAFAGTLAINVGLVVGYLVFLRRDDVPINEAATVFFTVLLTLIITLFDRFQSQRRITAPLPSEQR